MSPTATYEHLEARANDLDKQVIQALAVAGKGDQERITECEKKLRMDLVSRSVGQSA